MGKKRIFSTLIKNYILFTTILILIVIITMVMAGSTLTWLMSDESMPNITPESIVRPDYEKIDITDLEIAGGWVEILDVQGKVEFVKGNKLTSEMAYNMMELSDLLGFQDKHSYFYQSNSFQSSDGAEKIILVVIPYGAIDYNISLKFGVFDVSKKLIQVLIISGITFFMLFLVNIFFYSKWTSRKIKRPLEQITGVIEKMSDGDLEARMTFDAEYEFSQIKEAFNQMAERLRASEAEKSRMEATRNQMFVHIAHDLITPITTINGFSKALSDGLIKDSDKIKSYLETIHSKSNRMTKLIDDIFDLAKLESFDKKQVMNRENLIETVRAVLAEYFEQVEEKKMQLEFDSNVETCFTHYNSKEISRVISNLLSNAINYNQEGTEIRVQIQSETNWVQIDIEDNGVGIPEEFKESVFMPFIRGDYARTSDGGSGLGLAISKKIVANHGGSIELISDGASLKTLFRIRLPRT